MVNFRLDESRIDINYLENNKSGNDPTSFTYGFYYNTNDNTIFDYRATKNYQTSLPLAIITDNGTTVSSIDQVFNGFGYIGSTAFALPGVKGLFPDGRNEDGTLKTREFINSVVRIHNVSGTYSVKLCLATSGIGAYFYAYDEVKNAIYRTDTGAYYPSDRLIVGDISYTNGVITSLQPKTTFHAVDYSDKPEISGWSMPSNRYFSPTLGASGSSYTAPANGWFNFVHEGSNGQWIFLTNQSNGFEVDGTINGQGYARIFIPCKKGDIIRTDYSTTGSYKRLNFYYAEGEN